jgi:protein-S-isoprenylcysteine O-methyltransferase Ste14
MSKPTPHEPWWKGSRGEWYVAAQFFFALVAFGPRTLPGWPAWVAPWTWLASVAGTALIAAGGALAVAAVLKLGADLTVLPAPKDGACLVQTGAYGIVRHPIYSGLIMAAFGWGSWVHGWLTLGYALLLFAFFDIKSRREEQWLVEKFPEYAEYQRRVRKLIPWVH